MKCHINWHIGQFEWNLILNFQKHNISCISVPSSPPLNFRASSPESTKIKIMWEAPPEDHINGVMEGYQIQYGIADDAEVYAVSIEDKERTVNIHFHHYNSRTSTNNYRSTTATSLKQFLDFPKCSIRGMGKLSGEKLCHFIFAFLFSGILLLYSRISVARTLMAHLARAILNSFLRTNRKKSHSCRHYCILDNFGWFSFWLW